MRKEQLYHRRLKGFSLVELMVALTISMFLLLGVFQVFFGASSSGRMGDAMARVQESGRFAMDFITRELRRVGYQSCVESEAINLSGGFFNGDLEDHELQAYRLNSSASEPDGWDDLGLPDLNNAVGNSDVLYFANADGLNTFSVNCTDTACTTISTEMSDLVDSSGLDSGDLLLVTDCATADIYTIDSISTDTSGSETLKTLEAGASLIEGEYEDPDDDEYIQPRAMPYIARLLFVGTTDRGTPALYAMDMDPSESDNWGGRQEYIEGVERMLFEFGERDSSGNIRFVPPGTSNLDYGDVDTVRVHLLMVSNAEVLSQDDTTYYAMGNVQIAPSTDSGASLTYDATDRRLRRVFSSTIWLRNR